MKYAAYTPWVDPPAHAPVQRHACRGCKHFTPGAINPDAGMGHCTLKNIGTYPGADLRCPDWTHHLRSNP